MMTIDNDEIMNLRNYSLNSHISLPSSKHVLGENASFRDQSKSNSKWHGTVYTRYNMQDSIPPSKAKFFLKLAWTFPFASTLECLGFLDRDH